MYINYASAEFTRKNSGGLHDKTSAFLKLLLQNIFSVISVSSVVNKMLSKNIVIQNEQHKCEKDRHTGLLYPDLNNIRNRSAEYCLV